MTMKVSAGDKDLDVDELVGAIEQFNGLQYWSSRHGGWEDRGFGDFRDRFLVAPVGMLLRIM